MSTVIEQFYRENHIPQVLLAKKLKKLAANPDICREFEYWIQNRKYQADGALSIEGYTAEKLATLSEYLDGEGAFMLLMELRENPEKTLRRIEKGFKVK